MILHSILEDTFHIEYTHNTHSPNVVPVRIIHPYYILIWKWYWTGLRFLRFFFLPSVHSTISHFHGNFSGARILIACHIIYGRFLNFHIKSLPFLPSQTKFSCAKIFSKASSIFNARKRFLQVSVSFQLLSLRCVVPSFHSHSNQIKLCAIPLDFSVLCVNIIFFFFGCVPIICADLQTETK